MPRHHQPPSLKTSSLLNIAKHIDTYWCNGPNARLLETPRLLYIIGPFDYLGDDLLQQLIEVLATCKSLRRYHLQLIIHSNVRSLNLSMCQSAANHASVIDTLGQRCQKLTHLKLSKLRQVHAKVFCNLVSNLPQLQSLDLSQTKCNGNVLQAISSSNFFLTDLNISGCSVKETELLYLCNLSGEPRPFPDLRKLCIEGIHASSKTVAPLLQCHMNLVALIGPSSICSALQNMYGETYNSGDTISPENCHKLNEVLISFVDFPGSHSMMVKSRYVELLVAYCPYLTKLVFFGAEDDKALAPIAQLQHLCSLEIYSDYGYITFQNGIVPLLKTCGPNLLKVALHFVPGMDMLTVGELCPNICNLDISVSKPRPDRVLEEFEPRPISQAQPWYFAKLEKLHLLICSEAKTLPENILGLILNNATRISYINMINMVSLTDATISHAVEKHGFKHLEEVEFKNCDTITAEAGWMLLDCDGPLHRLWIPSCHSITLADWENFRKHCKKNHLQVDVFWT